VGSCWPRSRKLWWIPFWITSSINNFASFTSAFSQPPKLKGDPYNPTRNLHYQLHLPIANSFFAQNLGNNMAPSPRASRSTRRSSSNSTPLDEQVTSKEKDLTPLPEKKRKVASPKKAKSSSKAKAKPSPDNTTAESPAKKAKKVSAPKHQVLTERDEIPKLFDSDEAKQNGSYSKLVTVSPPLLERVFLFRLHLHLPR
jgi:hypothetical protein